MDDKTFLLKVFGDYPQIKVLDFLLTYREYDYPLSEIAENAGVGWTTIHQFFPSLVEQGLVKKTRKIGRAILYKLNVENEIVQELIDMDKILVNYFIEKELDTVKMKVKAK